MERFNKSTGRSPEMRKRQETALNGFNVTWLNYFSELPQKPLFLVANEFFDCLPIKQYRRTDEGWQEQMIAVENEQLHFILGTATSEEVFSKTNDVPNGDMLEVSPPTVAFASAIGEHIQGNGGAVEFKCPVSTCEGNPSLGEQK